MSMKQKLSLFQLVEEKINAKLGIVLKEKGVERVICRAESPKIEANLKENGIEVFSTLLSTKTLLRACN